MHIEQLHLEVTRRCTLECEHCFRGDSQNINIKAETLKNVFSNVDKIDKLLITGGEPFLAINELEEMIDLIKKYNVKIEKINIVTNGTVLSSKVLKVLKSLSQISDLELSISFDIFHLLQLEKKNLKEKRDKNVEFLKENFNTKEFGDEKRLKDESQYAKHQILQPIGNLMGLDGVILLAFLLGLPANEIVIPIMLMTYLSTNTLTDYDSAEALKTILVDNGWSITTAISFLIFTLFHFPCATTLMTIKKETDSWFVCFLSFIIPLCIGIMLCILVNLII